MAAFNVALDMFIHGLFRAYDLGIFAAIMVVAMVLTFWMTLERQDLKPGRWIYIVTFACLTNAMAIVWLWGMSWEWNAISALAPLIGSVFGGFVPRIPASYWNDPSSNSIFLVNLLAGSTLMVGVLAIRWTQHSFSHEMERAYATDLKPPPDSSLSRESGRSLFVWNETLPRVRCAIYTRQPCEEGVKQFNSVQVQREACASLIESHAAEGWQLVGSTYDDDYLSGDTTERPGLERLLADVQQKLVDAVVVYKLDRLACSLADFSKLMDLFDTHGVSFLTVTDQFNTSTPEGRHTLDVLLSLAQSERETAEKHSNNQIARKIMWRGTRPPFGYDLKDGRLVVNEAEAETVREICRMYERLGSLSKLKDHLDEQGIRSKPRISADGVKLEGRRFSCKTLYSLLSNPLYIGVIRHKGSGHPGQHPPILDRNLWHRVQEQLSQIPTSDTYSQSPRPVDMLES